MRCNPLLVAVARYMWCVCISSEGGYAVVRDGDPSFAATGSNAISIIISDVKEGCNGRLVPWYYSGQNWIMPPGLMNEPMKLAAIKVSIPGQSLILSEMPMK